MCNFVHVAIHNEVIFGFQAWNEENHPIYWNIQVFQTPCPLEHLRTCLRTETVGWVFNSLKFLIKNNLIQ